MLSRICPPDVVRVASSASKLWFLHRVCVCASRGDATNDPPQFSPKATTVTSSHFGEISADFISVSVPLGTFHQGSSNYSIAPIHSWLSIFPSLQDGPKVEDEFGFSSTESEPEFEEVSAQLVLVHGTVNAQKAEPAGDMLRTHFEVVTSTMKSGWLQKMSDSSTVLFKRRWKRRWFSIQDTVIKYFRKRPEGGEAAGTSSASLAKANPRLTLRSLRDGTRKFDGFTRTIYVLMYAHFLQGTLCWIKHHLCDLHQAVDLQYSIISVPST